jgi:hypothetical protein
MLALIRGHWSAIENGTHYWRDATFAEDANRTADRNGAPVLASLRNLANGIYELQKQRNATTADSLRSWCQQQTFTTVWPLLQRLNDENILLICQRKLWLPLTRGFLENKQSHLQRLRREVEADLRRQVDAYTGSESRDDLRSHVEAGLDRWADWFTSNFQATLNSKTLTCLIQGNEKPEGLARIFETINSTGLSLSVFDLLVARLGTWQSGS